MAGEGPIVRHSEFGQAAAVTRLEAAIRANGMCVFARIDHTASAAEEGVSLRPTVVLVFGIGRGLASLVGAIPAGCRARVPGAGVGGRQGRDVALL